MRHAAVRLGVLACALAFLGMGDLSGSTDDQIPVPDEYFAATITDKALVTVRAENLACGGHTFLKVQRGKALVMIPFARIRSVELRDVAEGDVQEATVTLTDGTVHNVQVKNRLLCTGFTDLGAMKIRIGDLRRVEFEVGAARPEPEKK